MTKTEFIESDIIEKYVLGVATDDEVALLNKMCKQFPEIKEEINDYEQSLMLYAEGDRSPSPHVKHKLFEAINKQTKDSSKTNEAKIVDHPTSAFQNKFKLFAIAASILCIISLGINYNLFSKLQDAHNQLAILQNEKNILVEDMEVKKASFQKTEEDLQAILNTSTQTVILKGVVSSPTSKAIVYWNESVHTTHILVSNLPIPPVGKQYQLWALANGRPIDAGVFNIETTLQQVKNIDAAQAFAVTLEDKGGSTIPTLTAMYVIGNI